MFYRFSGDPDNAYSTVHMNPEHFMHNYSKIWFSTAQETSRNGPLYGERDHTRPFARSATQQ